jgi:hypothetical protein
MGISFFFDPDQKLPVKIEIGELVFRMKGLRSSLLRIVYVFAKIQPIGIPVAGRTLISAIFKVVTLLKIVAFLVPCFVHVFALCCLFDPERDQLITITLPYFVSWSSKVNSKRF